MEERIAVYGAGTIGSCEATLIIGHGLPCTVIGHSEKGLERCRKGHPNRRALTLWRWLRHLSKADGIPLDEDLLALAEKARFSQHTITDEELQVLEDARDRRIAALRSQPMKKRLWQRYGQVLY